MWTPIKEGTYTIKAQITDSTGKVVEKTLNYVINPAITINAFTTSEVSPQELGWAITLSTTSSGGTGTLQSKFAVYDGTALTKWSIIKDFGVEGSVSWKPTKAGTYILSVDVKDTRGKIASKTLKYVITTPLTISKFIAVNGITTTVIKESSEANTVVWTPIKEGSYTIKAQITDSTGKIVEKTLDYVIKGSCKVNGIVWDYEVNTMGNAINVYPSDKTLTIVKVPSTLNGKKVTSIKEAAFLNYGSLSSIIIPEGVTSIGKETFKNCTSLKRISIPSDVTNIDATAFEDCVKLTNIYTSSGSNASSYNWKYGSVNTKIGYTKGSLIIELGDYDTNSDSVVNIIDLANVAKNYNTSKSDKDWQELYDYNCDGKIDIYDLVKISKKIS